MPKPIYKNIAFLQRAIRFAEDRLIKKADKKADVWENFGQDEVRKLEDAYIDSSVYTEAMNRGRDRINAFSHWCGTYSVNGGTYQYIGRAY